MIGRGMLAAVVILAGCASPLSQARGNFFHALRLKEQNDPYARDYFQRSKDTLFDLIQLQQLDDRNKVGPLSYLIRIYLEERDIANADRYIVRGAGYIEPTETYDGDEVSLGLIAGEYYVRSALHTIVNADEDDEQTAALWESAVKDLELALIRYFAISGKSKDVFIDQYIDLRKVRAFVEKAAIYKRWKRGGRKELLTKAAANYRSALTIAERNAGVSMTFGNQYAEYRKHISSELEKLTEAMR